MCVTPRLVFFLLLRKWRAFQTHLISGGGFAANATRVKRAHQQQLIDLAATGALHYIHKVGAALHE